MYEFISNYDEADDEQQGRQVVEDVVGKYIHYLRGIPRDQVGREAIRAAVAGQVASCVGPWPDLPPALPAGRRRERWRGDLLMQPEQVFEPRQLRGEGLGPVEASPARSMAA